ncbi:hypothetical protein ACI65C_007028 [Semiaphis heraclei]
MKVFLKYIEIHSLTGKDVASAILEDGIICLNSDDEDEHTNVDLNGTNIIEDSNDEMDNINEPSMSSNCQLALKEKNVTVHCGTETLKKRKELKDSSAHYLCSYTTHKLVQPTLPSRNLVAPHSCDCVSAAVTNNSQARRLLGSQYDTLVAAQVHTHQITCGSRMDTRNWPRGRASPNHNALQME